MPLILALLGLITMRQSASDRVMVIDRDSGMAVELPQPPRHSFKQLGDLTQSVYLSKNQDFSFLFIVTSPPRDDERFLDSNSLDTLDKKIGALIPGVIDERTPAIFGPCRGYAYAGHKDMGDGIVKYDARFVLVGTCWVLMEVFGMTDPAKSPETQDYFNSLVLTTTGARLLAPGGLIVCLDEHLRSPNHPPPNPSIRKHSFNLSWTPFRQ